MPSPDGHVDLRSDTVTTPTDAMRAAMAAAVVGDDMYGEDPTVRELEELAADLTGKEAALFTVSGTLANQLAIRVLARRGTEVLCPARAHVYRYEHAAAAGNAGVQLRPLPDADGLIDPEDVAAAVADTRHHLPPASLVTIENSHMPASGRALTPAQVADVAWAAAAHGLPLHCDGARIANASVALGVTVAELAGPADSVMFCVSKGLAAPIGSLLCGAADLIAEARDQRARLGGGWRQAGIVAAAGIVALREMVDRLEEDHRRARVLADALATRFPGALDPEAVQTNIVCADLAALPAGVVEQLAGMGVRTGTIDARTLRLVTHKDVDDDDVARAVRALDELVGDPPAGRAAVDTAPAAPVDIDIDTEIDISRGIDRDSEETR